MKEYCELIFIVAIHCLMNASQMSNMNTCIHLENDHVTYRPTELLEMLRSDQNIIFLVRSLNKISDQSYSMFLSSIYSRFSIIMCFFADMFCIIYMFNYYLFVQLQQCNYYVYVFQLSYRKYFLSYSLSLGFELSYKFPPLIMTYCVFHITQDYSCKHSNWKEIKCKI